MSLLDNVSMAELELRNTGIYSPEIDDYQDIALNSFDMGYLDYNAAGSEGWLNRLKGVFAGINPASWYNSAMANYERLEQSKEPGEEIGVGDMFGVAGKTVWDVGVTGFLMGGMNTLERVVAIAGTGIYQGLDIVNDLQEGRGIDERIVDPEYWAKMFDLKAMEKVGTGDLLLLNSGVIAAILTPFTREQLGKAAGFLPNTDELKWLNGDFDPLNPEDISLFDEERQLGKVAGVLNFVGEIIWDPLNFVSFGAWSAVKAPLTASYKFSYGYTKKGAKRANFLRDENNLVKVMNGSKDEVTDNMLLDYVSAFAKSSGDEAFDVANNEFLLRKFGAEGTDSSNLAWLLSRTNNEEQVSTILLAINFSNKQARMNLKKMFDGDPDAMLKFDDMFNGGTAITQTLKNPNIFEVTPFLDETLEGVQEYAKYSSQYVSNVSKKMDEFKNVLENMLPKTDDGLVNLDEIVDPLFNRTFRSTGIYVQTFKPLQNLYSASSIKFARFRASVVMNTSDTLGISLFDNVLGKTIIKYYRKATSSTLRGAVNFNSPGRDLTDKFYSFLNEADTVLRGGLRVVDEKIGESQFNKLVNEFSSASTTQEYKEIFDKIHMIVIRNLAEQNNMLNTLFQPKMVKVNGELVEQTTNYWEDFIQPFYANIRNNQDYATATLMKGGQVEYSGMRVIETAEDMRLISENANWYQTINLYDLAKYFNEFIETSIPGVSKGAQTSQFVGEFIRQFNTYWSAGVLLRPARFLRERFANGLGIILAGMAPMLWLNGDVPRMIANTFKNVVKSGQDFAKKSKAKKALYDVVDGDTVKIKGNLGASVKTIGNKVESINNSINQLEAVANNVETRLINQSHRQLDVADKENYQYEVEMNKVETKYHGSVDEFDVENLDDARMLPLSKTAKEAEQIATDNFGRTPESIDILEKSLPEKIAYYKDAKVELQRKIKVLQNAKNLLPEEKRVIINAEETLNAVKEELGSLLKERKSLINRKVFSDKTGKVVQLQGNRIFSSETVYDFISKQAGRDEVLVARKLYSRGDYQIADESTFKGMSLEELNKYDFKIIPKPKQKRVQLDEYVKNLTLDEKLSIGSASRTPVSITNRLSVDPEPTIRANVASNQNVQPTVLTKLSADSEVSVRMAAAENVSNSKTNLIKLAEDDNVDVVLKAVNNPKADDAVYSAAIKSNEPKVLTAVLNNPNASDDVIGELFTAATKLEEKINILTRIKGSFKDVKNNAEIQAVLANQSSAVKATIQQVRASNPNASKTFLEKLANESELPDVLKAVAANSNTPPKALTKLANDSEELAQIVVKNPKAEDIVKAKYGDVKVKEELAETATSSRVLNLLSKEASSEIKQKVALNKYTSKATLKNLLTDPDEYVVIQVVKNPNIQSEAINAFYTVNKKNNFKNMGAKVPSVVFEEAIAANPATSAKLVKEIYDNLSSGNYPTQEILHNILQHKGVTPDEKLKYVSNIIKNRDDITDYFDYITNVKQLENFHATAKKALSAEIKKATGSVKTKYVNMLTELDTIGLRHSEADTDFIMKLYESSPELVKEEYLTIIVNSSNIEKLPADFIQQLIKSNQHVDAIIDSNVATAEILEDVFRVTNFEEEPFRLQHFAFNPNTPENILRDVFNITKKLDTEVDGVKPIKNIIQNYLADDFAANTYKKFAFNPNTPTDVLDEILSTTTDNTIIRTILLNENVSPEALDKLALAADNTTRNRVILHPNVSEETISKMVQNISGNDPNGELLASHPYISSEKAEDTMLAIFGYKANPALTSEIIESIAEARKVVTPPAAAPVDDVDGFVLETFNLKKDVVAKTSKDVAKPLTKAKYDEQLKNIENDIARSKKEIEAMNSLSKEFMDVEGDIGSIDNIERKLSSQMKSTEKRIQKSLDERKEFASSYAENIIDQLDEGEVIWVKPKGSSGSYTVMPNERFMKLNVRGIKKLDIKFGKPNSNPKAHRVSYGGETLSLTSFDALPQEIKTILKIKNEAQFNKVFTNEEFRNNKEFIDWVNENGYGKVEIKQGKKTITFTTSKFVTSPRKDVAKELAVEKVAKDLDDVSLDAKELETVNTTYRNRKELIERDDEIKGYINTYSQLAKQADSYEERLQLLADLRAKIDVLKDFRNKLEDRYSAATNLFEEIRTTKNTVFKGSRVIQSSNGVKYTVDNILEGEEGEITEKILQANSIIGDSINSIDGQLYRSIDGIEQYDIKVLNPNSADYYRDYAGYIKFFLKNDGAAMRVAKKLNELKDSIRLSGGEITEDVLEEVHKDLVKWLRSTPEGKQYAIEARIGRRYSKLNAPDEGEGAYSTMEEFAVKMTDFISYELYDDNVLKLVASGDTINEQALRAALNGKDLQPVKGRKPITTNSLSNRGPKATINKIIAETNKLLVEKPQTYLENVPMAQQYYMREMETMINANEKALGRALTVDEISRISTRARKKSVKETRKWIYNVQDKWRITEAINMYIPFITAITFTNKMLFRAAKEHPEKLLWRIGAGTKIMGEFAYADQDGNPIGVNDAVMNPNAALVLPMPDPVREAFSKIPILGPAFVEGKNFRVSMRSLNVWYGQEYVPGPGPIVAVPMNIFTQVAPKAVYDINDVLKRGVGFDWLEWALPFGIQDDLLSQILPTWFNQAKDLLFAGQRYQDAFAKTMAYEAGRYSIDPNNYSAPDEDEIRKTVNAIFAFDLISSTSLLASTKIETEADYYRRIHRQLIDEYGKQEADWIMLSKYPEFIGVTVSTTENPYAVNANVETFYKLEDMPQVSDIFEYSGEGAKDMLGWAVNPTGVGRYDDYFWDYLTNKSPSPGAEPYRRILSPEEIRIKASAAAGWATYNKFHDALDSYAIEKNIEWKDDKKASLYRSELIKELTNLYPSWSSEYKSTNFNRYEERAFALDLLLNEPEWLQSARFDTKEFKEFNELRKMIKNDLNNKGLTLASSPVHKKYYEESINQLKKKNVAFSTFYNKFFLDERI